MDNIDFNYEECVQSHYEHMVQINVNDAARLKKRVFLAMKELEGWCSEEKASILIDLILLTKPKTVVEIGVFGGKSLVPMAFALKENKMGRVYGIDPWSRIASVEGMDGANKDYWSSVDHEAIYQGLVQKLHKFELTNQAILIKNSSEGAAPIPEIDILHIDGNHSEKAAVFDAQKWVPLVKKGGLIIFDDINWAIAGGIWMDQHCIKIAEVRGDNVWAIWVKP